MTLAPDAEGATTGCAREAVAPLPRDPHHPLEQLNDLYKRMRTSPDGGYGAAHDASASALGNSLVRCFVVAVVAPSFSDVMLDVVSDVVSHDAPLYVVPQANVVPPTSAALKVCAGVFGGWFCLVVFGGRFCLVFFAVYTQHDMSSSSSIKMCGFAIHQPQQ